MVTIALAPVLCDMPKETCPPTPGRPIGMASTTPHFTREGARPYLESPHAAVREAAFIAVCATEAE
jgi:hypothetical protein